MNQIEKRFQKLLIFFILLLTLSACWDSDPKQTPTDEVEIIDGHTLPPDPGEVGKQTLLGIDSNNDGIRDDVERWIYKTYNHPIERAIFMQTARAYQVVITDPEKARENVQVMHNAVDCESYWSLNAKENNESFWLDEYRSLSKEIKPIQFNTAERFLAYQAYNHNLSGGVYGSSGIKAWKSKCDFNSTELLADEKNPGRD